MALVATLETSPAGVPRVRLDLTWDLPSGAAVVGDTRNALTAQAQSFESAGVGGWQVTNGSAAQTTAQAAVGTGSLAGTSTAGVMTFISPYVSVKAGQTVTVSVAVRSATVARTATLQVESAADGVSGASDSKATTTTGWTYYTVTRVAGTVDTSFRIRLGVSGTSASEVHYLDAAAVMPVPVQVSLSRTSGGTTRTIRNGNPALMNGTTLAAFDYEAPFDVATTWTADDLTGGLYSFTSGSVTPTSGGVPWIVHPGLPELSEPLRVMEWPTWTRPASAGIFQPIGRRNAVMVSSVRQSERGSLVCYTASKAAADGIASILADGAPLLIKGTSSDGWGSRWVAVGEVTEQPVDDGPGQQVGAWCVWTLPLTVIDEPTGLVGNIISYASSTAASASYAASLLKAPTFANRSAGYLLT